MKKLNKIVTTLVITGMLTLPVLGIVFKTHVSWVTGPSTNDVSWNS